MATNDKRRWLVDGLSMDARQICDAALEYGYAGDDPEEAAEVLRAWESDGPPISWHRGNLSEAAAHKKSPVFPGFREFLVSRTEYFPGLLMG